MRVVWIDGAPAATVAVVAHYCSLASRVIELPPTARFSSRRLDGGWGATVLGGRLSGTVHLDARLTPHEVALILSHELIHLHQIHSGRLGGTASGMITWHGVLWQDTAGLSYQEYTQLPWEEEAFRRQEWLLGEVVRLGLQNAENGQTAG